MQRLHGWQQSKEMAAGEESSRSDPPVQTQVVSFAVPPGAVVGQKLTFTTPDGVSASVLLPEGFGPGETLQVRVAKPVAPAAKPSKKRPAPDSGARRRWLSSSPPW